MISKNNNTSLIRVWVQKKCFHKQCQDITSYWERSGLFVCVYVYDNDTSQVAYNVKWRDEEEISRWQFSKWPCDGFYYVSTHIMVF